VRVRDRVYVKKLSIRDFTKEEAEMIVRGINRQ
jgi:hypothetical protein